MLSEAKHPATSTEQVTFGGEKNRRFSRYVEYKVARSSWILRFAQNDNVKGACDDPLLSAPGLDFDLDRNCLADAGN